MESLKIREFIVKGSLTKVKNEAQLLIILVLLNTRELVVEGTPINVLCATLISSGVACIVKLHFRAWTHEAGSQCSFPD